MCITLDSPVIIEIGEDDYPSIKLFELIELARKKDSWKINNNQSYAYDCSEAFFLLYPIDGVAINDMPFAYINNDAKEIGRAHV